MRDLLQHLANGGAVPRPGAENHDRQLVLDGITFGYRSVLLPNGELQITTYQVQS